MKTRIAFALSALALASAASAAPAFQMPAAGETPFALESAEPSTLTRDHVLAAAIASPPRTGDVPYREDSVRPSILTRGEVLAEAITSPPQSGEMSSVAAATPARPVIREAEIAPGEEAGVVRSQALSPWSD